MASQPSEQSIQDVINLTGLSHTEAAARLKNNSNNVSQAINDYFDNPGNTYNTAWDDSQFGADREGVIEAQRPSFQINGQDEHDIGIGQLSGAPSRPPSRTDNTSPMGRVVSLAAEAAAADPYSRMSQDEIHDVELQKALEASRESAGLPPQDYGIVENKSVKFFGPANHQKEYKDDQWGLVHMPQNANGASEGLPDPVDRKREVGTPAFLRPALNKHRVPALVTILHEIPLLRESLLDRGNAVSEYGYEKEWWKGEPIASFERLPLESGVDRVPRPNNKFTLEMQRLMAFLDMTERSYGSAEALYKTMTKVVTKDAEALLFTKWKTSQTDESVIKGVFSTAIQPSASNSMPEELQFALSDFDLPTGHSASDVNNLYDLADSSLWNGSGDDAESSAYMSHVGEMFCFRLSTKTGTKAVEIPLVWYPDRYLEENKKAALEMRLRKQQLRNQLNAATVMEAKLTNISLKGGTTVKVKYLLERSIKYASEPMEVVAGPPSDSDDNNMHTNPGKYDHRDLAAELKRVMEKIETKLSELKQERDHALAAMKELSSLYTTPTPDNPLHAYTLRGVSATKNLTFVCCRAEPDLIDMDLDNDEPKVEHDQWWRIAFTASMPDRKPVEIMKVSEADVLTALATDSIDPLLVYASEKAMTFSRHPLHPALESFVRADNLAFQAEFPDSASEANSEVDTNSPKSPSKRKIGERNEADSSQELLPPRYADKSVKWGSNPASLAAGNIGPSTKNLEDLQVSASHHEVQSVDLMGSGVDDDAIIGIDPEENVLKTTDEVHEQKSLSMEMQERIGMPSLLSSSLVGAAPPSSTVGQEPASHVGGIKEEDAAARNAATIAAEKASAKRLEAWAAKAQR